MRRNLGLSAVLSLLLGLTACGTRGLDGKWEVSVKTPFFEGRVLSVILNLESGQVRGSGGDRIGSYQLAAGKVQVLDFDLSAGGISGFSLQDGSFVDGDHIEGSTVVLKRRAFGDTLKGIWWKARRLE